MNDQQISMAQSVIDRIGVTVALDLVSERDSPNGDGRIAFEYRATVSRVGRPEQRFTFEMWAIQAAGAIVEPPTAYNAVECMSAYANDPSDPVELTRKHEKLLPHQISDLSSFVGGLRAFFTEEERRAIRRFRRFGKRDAGIERR